MRPSRSAVWTVALLAGLSLALVPDAALAKKKKKRARRAAAAATVPNGNGLGPGGVPALRDALNARIDAVQMAVDQVEQRTSDLEDTVGTLEGDLGTLRGDVDALQGDVQSLGLQVMTLGATVGDLDQRLAAIEMLTTDDDGDTLAEFQGDCDDTNAAVSPLAAEVPGNGIDDDCDFAVDEMDPAPMP